MKQKYRGLRLYLLGLTAGAFIFGWSIIARSDATQVASTNTDSSQNSSLNAATNTQQSFFQPRIRTRTS